MICKNASKKIKDRLAMRRNTVYNHLYKNYKKDFWYERFQDEYENILSLVKERPSVENLKSLDHFLSKSEVKKNWYVDKYTSKI